VSYQVATLGDVLAEPPVITSWRSAVRARGNADVIAPRGAAFAGQLAERIDAARVPTGMYYPSPAIRIGSYWYVPAPVGVQSAWKDMVRADANAQASNDFFTSVQSIPSAIASDAGKLAKTAVSAITGIPSWAIPILLIGGGAFVLIQAAHSFLPDRRR
jgi:hypothetical protein